MLHGSEKKRLGWRKTNLLKMRCCSHFTFSRVPGTTLRVGTVNAGRGRWRCINEAHIIEADLSSVKGGLTAFERDSVDPVRGTSTRGGLFHY